MRLFCNFFLSQCSSHRNKRIPGHSSLRHKALWEGIFIISYIHIYNWLGKLVYDNFLWYLGYRCWWLMGKCRVLRLTNLFIMNAWYTLPFCPTQSKCIKFFFLSYVLHRDWLYLKLIENGIHIYNQRLK